MAWKRRRTRRAGRQGGKKGGLERGGKKGGLERGGRRVTEGRKREQRREGVLSSRADARDTMAEWGEGNV